MRRTHAARALLSASLAAGLAACAPRAPGPPAFAGQDCAVHAVIAEDTAEPLSGIEDLALGPAGTLLLSAQDRPAVEQALQSGATPPEGGLYRVGLDAVLAGSTRASPVLPRASVTGGLRPHGIATRDDRVAVVNRRTGTSGGLDPVILELRLPPAGAASGEARVEAIHRGPGFCALNDVVFDGDLLLATLDRGACGGAGLADLFPGAATGRLVEVGPDGNRVVAEGFAFANGVTLTGSGLVAVAETRGGRIRLSDGRVLEVPGAPDNLSTAADGRIVAALHPRLIRFALWRYGWLDRAPSRIVAVDPGSGSLRLLFDDASGEIFPGATSALLLGDALVAGSVLAPGLLVCRKPAR